MNGQWRFWISWSLGLALLLVLAVYVVLQWNLNNYSRLVADRLLLLGELRRGALQEYFATAEAELRFWSTNQSMLDAQADLLQIWRADPGTRDRVRRAYVEANPHPEGFRLNLDDAGDGGNYSELHARVHASARLFVTERGYYDFFLISPEGDVLYTVEKESDFVTNLVNGPYRETGLGKAFQKVRKNSREDVVVLTDLEPYQPSDGAPAIFMAKALNDPAGTFIGAIAFQLPTDGILAIMNYTSGMGETGETYLVGPDKLMRSDSRFTDESTVLIQTVDTPTVERALAGEQGMDYILDYRGVEVMSVYLPTEVGNIRWAIMAEIDSAEIQEGAARERPAMSGALLLLYGLGLWSVWYWRGRVMPENTDHYVSLDLGDIDSGGIDS